MPSSLTACPISATEAADRHETGAMVQRVRSLRPDARLPADIWGMPRSVNGVTFQASLPPGPERDQILRQLRDHLEAQASSLGSAISSLRSLIAQHEPVEFISSIAIPTGMALRGPGEWDDDAKEASGWSAKIEYLAGLALSLPPGTGSTPNAVTERAIDLLGDVFDAAQARQLLDSFERPSTGHPHLDWTLFLLGLEYLTDRMPGYAVHLQQIDEEVFDRHRQYYVDAIGFNPGDVTRLVRRRIASDAERVNAARRRAQSVFKRDRHQAAASMVEMYQALDGSRRWEPDSVAADTGIDAAEVAALLRFFATTFASQPDFRSPIEPNLARTRPCIDLGNGIYFLPDTWSLPAAVHPRLAHVVGQDPEGPLKRYRHHRERGHQRLVAGALRHVVGDSRVLETQHYTSMTEGPGEIDVIVPSEWPLVIEAKAGGLTDAGRRGRADRVATVADNVVNKGLDQTRRARTYIQTEGGRSFANSQGGQNVDHLPADLEGLTDIIVTFERMDPLHTAGPALVRQQGRAVWVVSLADLLMVTDVLADAAAFHHYARTRASTLVSGPVVFMESDALGGYLVDRLVHQLAMAKQNPDQLLLDYSSAEINKYFTLREMGQEAPRPTTGVPEPVNCALNATQEAAGWVDVVDTVMATPAGRWKQWRAFFRRHRTGGTFTLAPNVQLTISVSGGLKRAEAGLPAQLYVSPGGRARSR